MYQGTPGFPQTRSWTGTEPGPDRTRNTAHGDMHFSDILIPFGAQTCPGLGCQRLKKYSNLADYNHFNCDLLVWWLWFLLDRFWLPKIEKVFKSGCWCASAFIPSWRVAVEGLRAPWGQDRFKPCQIWSSGLVILVPFGHVWAAKASKSIQIWLITIISFNNSDLLVWWLWFLLDRFGLPKLEKVFESGCWCVRFSFLLEGLRLKGCGRYRIRTGSNHVKSDPLVWWFWFLLDTFGLPKFEKVFKSGWLQLFQFNNSDSGLVTLIPFGQVWAAKAWKSIQIWLLVCPLFIPSWMVAAEGLRAL